MVVQYKDSLLTLRSGYLEENPDVPFRGNVIYYEGLGDSMLNHQPLFSALTAIGFRVIAYDYMGQGGSAGRMNNTTIASIADIGIVAFDANRKTDCSTCNEMNIIGWSTGGLAAYRAAAYDGGVKIKKIVLIAPGISPNMIVGEGIVSWPPNRISLRSLTSDDYQKAKNPHVDRIKPNSPLEVPLFAFNLLKTACAAEKWRINKNVHGFVLLSDPKEDTYVDADKTLQIISRNANHFSYSIYKGARHEIDNERPEISNKAINEIVHFLAD